VQAPFVSSEEINSVIKDIRKKYEDFLPDNINLQKIKISSSPTSGMREMEDSDNRNPAEEPTNDEDYMSARDYVISTGKASTSALQTAFRWGYNKSARIINDLELYGIIGPATSGRHREVLFGKNKESDVERLEREIKELENNKKEDNLYNIESNK
jgi:S-DNA-T family DNA segregation ATPase FtsK/SpoIIIE